jgi:hypothetical protein
LILLDRNNKDHVTSWSDIEATLIDRSQRLRILSGIALPNSHVNDDGDPHPDRCVVSLGITVPDFIKATCQVGLSSISNDNTAFRFALTDCWVEPDPDSGELKLTVNLAAKGEDTTLHGFGFQIVALYGNRTTGVWGQIRWSRNLLDATHPPRAKTAKHSSPLDVPSLAEVHAYIATTTASTDPNPGTFGKPFKEFDLGFVSPRGDVHADIDDFWVEYAFDHLPLGVPLRMAGTNPSKRFPGEVDVSQIPGPNPVKLTPAHLSERVDFRISQHRRPA